MSSNSKLDEILTLYNRVVITGPPGVGKSTLTKDIDSIRVDELIKGVPWAEQPGVIIARVIGQEKWVMEGCQAARALTKGLDADAVVVLKNPPYRPSNTAFAKRINRYIHIASHISSAAFYYIRIGVEN